MFGGLATLTLIITLLLPNHHKHVWTYREHGIVRQDEKCHDRAEQIVGLVKRRLPTAKVIAEASCSVDDQLPV